MGYAREDLELESRTSVRLSLIIHPALLPLALALCESLVRFVQVRERESSIEMDIVPILDMYQMLEHYLPAEHVDKVRNFTSRALAL